MKEIKRYTLFREKSKESKIITDGNNKSELLKLRNGWKNQILLVNVYAFLFDNKEQKWIE